MTSFPRPETSKLVLRMVLRLESLCWPNFTVPHLVELVIVSTLASDSFGKMTYAFLSSNEVGGGGAGIIIMLPTRVYCSHPLGKLIISTSMINLLKGLLIAAGQNCSKTSFLDVSEHLAA